MNSALLTLLHPRTRKGSRLKTDILYRKVKTSSIHVAPQNQYELDAKGAGRSFPTSDSAEDSSGVGKLFNNVKKNSSHSTVGDPISHNRPVNFVSEAEDDTTTAGNSDEGSMVTA